MIWRLFITLLSFGLASFAGYSAVHLGKIAAGIDHDKPVHLVPLRAYDRNQGRIPLDWRIVAIDVRVSGEVEIDAGPKLIAKVRETGQLIVYDTRDPEEPYLAQHNYEVGEPYIRIAGLTLSWHVVLAPIFAAFGIFILRVEAWRPRDLIGRPVPVRTYRGFSVPAEQVPRHRMLEAVRAWRSDADGQDRRAGLFRVGFWACMALLAALPLLVCALVALAMLWPAYFLIELRIGVTIVGGVAGVSLAFMIWPRFRVEDVEPLRDGEVDGFWKALGFRPESLGCPEIHEIGVAEGEELGVDGRPAWGLFGPTRRVLRVGLAQAATVTAPQLRLLIAHALLQHGRSGNRARATRAAVFERLLRLQDFYGANGGWLWSVPARLCGLVYRRALPTMAAEVAVAELSAAATLAEMEGVTAVAEALASEQAAQRLIIEELETVRIAAARDGTADQSYLEHLRRRIAVLSGIELEAYRDRALRRRAIAWTAEISIDALEPPLAEAVATAILPAVSEDGLGLLGPAGRRFWNRISKSQRQALAQAGRNDHPRWMAERERLDTLAHSPPPAEEAFAWAELIMLAKRHEGIPAARAHAETALALNPDAAVILGVGAQVLLDDDDPEGLVQADAALLATRRLEEANAFAVELCEAAANFAARNGDPETGDLYLAALGRWRQAIGRGINEWWGHLELTPKTEMRAWDLGAEQREVVARAARNASWVRAVWLIERRLTDFPEQWRPCVVASGGGPLERSWRMFRGRLSSMLQEFAGSIDLEEEAAVLLAERPLPPFRDDLARALDQVPGGRLSLQAPQP